MSKRKPKPITWPPYEKGQSATTSSQQLTSPPPRGKTSRGGSDWHHKVSVCHLECQGRSVCCQCVIIKLSSQLKVALRLNGDSPSSMTLALVAPHTFLSYSIPRELREWRLQTGADSVHKSGGLKLHEKYVSHFYTCCGPQGVWGGGEIHRGKYVSEDSCPFNGNFTVLVLKRELTDQLKDVLTIPSLPSLDENVFSQALRSGNHYFTLIQRGPLGVSEAHNVLLKHPSSLVANDQSVADRITAYIETSLLQYTCGHVGFFDVTSAGAGIVYFDQTTPDNALMLAAIHLYSRHDDEEITHCAISLPAIFHAIAGSRVCGVIPCLSLLVGACNHGNWRLRFYRDLQDCLHPNNDPEDKQKRYHWTSQLLTVCDYLSRDEARAVLRLDVTDPPQIVLASINLFSALLGCFQRVVESEGLSQFYCQISRVFLKKASERFYKGLERMFNRLYKHLGHSSSGDDVITVCVECWLKMCTLIGAKSSTLYEVTKFTRVKVLRDSPRFHDNAHFQRLFGDLALAFLTHTRMALHEAVDSAVSTALIQQLEQQNKALQSQLEQEKKALQSQLEKEKKALQSQLEQERKALQSQLEQERKAMQSQLEKMHAQQELMCNGIDDDPDDVSVISKPYTERLDSETLFWERDMISLLERDYQLRETVGKVFQTVTGAARNSSWEYLVQHLEERLKVRMDSLNRLSTQGMSEGDKICFIVKEWSEREEVTVGLFHEVCCELGNGAQVHKILSQIEQTERNRILLSLADCRNSRDEVI